jgi:hypothetical protein
MKKINLLFILVLILAFFASLLTFWQIFLYHPKKIPSPTSIPTPTPFSLLTPTPILNEGKGDSPLEILDSLKKNFPLVEFLPYETENFYLDYIAPLHLRATIKKATVSAQIKQEILNWIVSKGVDPQTHKIDFIPGP